MTKVLADPYVISVGFIHPKHLSIGGVWPDLDALEHHFSPQSEHGVGLTVLLKEESSCPIFAGYGLPDYMELMGGKANFYRMQAGDPPAYYGVEPWLYVPAIVARELEMDVKSMAGTRESRKVRFWRTEGNVPKGPGGAIPIYGPTFYARREALLRDLAHYKELFLKNGIDADTESPIPQEDRPPVFFSRDSGRLVSSTYCRKLRKRCRKNRLLP